MTRTTPVGMEHTATLKIANAPCSWGTLEFDGLASPPIAYGQMLDELVETGYSGTELGDWGYMPTDADALRRALEARHVTMVGAFVPVAFRHAQAHAPGTVHALRVARLLAAVAAPSYRPFLILADDNGTDPERTRQAGRIAERMGLSPDEWTTFAAGVDGIARAVLHETGLPTAFHHHCAGFVETSDEIERLLDRTDPALVGLVFDTGHYAFGAGLQGCDAVMDGLQRFGERIRHVHFKDCNPEVARRARKEGWDYFQALRHGIFCELGQGCVDFRTVTDGLRSQDYRGWIVVEQDVLPGIGAPRESARRNRTYLKQIGL